MSNKTMVKSRHSVTVVPWIVCSVTMLMLLLSTACKSNKRDHRAGRKNGLAKSAGKRSSGRGAQKPLLAVREADTSSQGPCNYIAITVNPGQQGTAVAHYTITACVLVGQGQLWGAKEKINNRFQYKILLGEARSLGDLLPSVGNAEGFRAGKQIRFRCKYEPQERAKKGDEHRLAIKVIQKDAQGAIVRQAQTEVTLIVKQNVN